MATKIQRPKSIHSSGGNGYNPARDRGALNKMGKTPKIIDLYKEEKRRVILNPRRWSADSTTDYRIGYGHKSDGDDGVNGTDDGVVMLVKSNRFHHYGSRSMFEEGRVSSVYDTNNEVADMSISDEDFPISVGRKDDVNYLDGGYWWDYFTRHRDVEDKE